MQIHEFAPNTLVKDKISEGEFTIAPIGDLQLMGSNDKQVALNRFKRHLEIVENEFPNVYYLGMGDYIDFMSPSNRESLKQAKGYDASREYIERAAYTLADEFLALVEKTKDRWLGLLSGHHFYESPDGTNTDQYIARKLEAPYLEKCGYISLTLARPDGKTRGTINIWCHHGVGSSKYPVSKLVNQVVPFWPEADLYFMGHMHACDHYRINRMVVRGQEVVEQNSLAVVTGGWLKSHTENQTSYIEEKMLSPRAVGQPIVVVKPYMDARGLFRRKL